MSREFSRIVRKARRDAYAVVQRDLLAVLPKGWQVHLAVGWGLTVFDDERKTIVGTYEDPPKRLPRGLRRALEQAADFCDLFGYGNEVLER